MADWRKALSLISSRDHCQKPVTPQQIFVLMKTYWRRLSSSSSEGVCKTASRRFDQDEYIPLSHTSSEDVLVKTNIFVLTTRLQEVFKTSSRQFQDFFKTSCKSAFKTSSKRFEDVFKTSSRRLALIFSRRFQDVLSS